MGYTTARVQTSTLTVGAIASAGAAIVHGAAAGIHADHVGLSRLFIVLAIAQGAAAILGFLRDDRVACGTLAGVNAVAAAGWLITRVTGVSSISGLQAAERPQPADTVAAVLALVAVAAAVGCATGRARVVTGRSLTTSAVIVGVLVVPGLADATSHQHATTNDHAAHDEPAVHDDHDDGHDADEHDGDHDDADGHEADRAGEADGAGPATPPTTVHEHDDGHDQEDGQDDDGVATVPYDPELPIDLGGVDGVTPQQQAFAENLVAATVRDLPQWSDPAVAEAAGFHSIGDGATGHEHFIQWDWIDDDVWLDPDAPESLVYEPQPDGSRRLVSAMYMLPTDTALDAVPDWGGALMQWHVHGDLCFTDDPVAPRVAGVKPIGATCDPPLVDGTLAPMIHVWIIPHECGPFAALDGLAGGQVPDGETVLCDHAHGAH